MVFADGYNLRDRLGASGYVHRILGRKVEMNYRLLWRQPVLFAALAVVACGCGGGSSAHAQMGFSTASINGSYGISYCVALPTASGPTQFLSGTGLYEADGAGHLTGAETTNANGQVCTGNLTGTYTVNRNGTGTASVTFTPTTAGCSPVSFQQSLVIVDGGQIVRVADTIPTEVTISEEWQKQM
jgi:hypothetical protein